MYQETVDSIISLMINSGQHAKMKPEAHGPQCLPINSYKSLIQHFSLSVAMATNKNE